MNTHPDWWRGAVIYQVYPRSFCDSNADGIGDLKGITEKLGYVASLGVDAVWISPIFTSPMKDFGYDVSDYRNVDPMFGSLKDFDDLVERAHQLGLKVMIDQVMSHTSDQHPWFMESRQDQTNPKRDWYVWVDPQADGSVPNNWLSVFGGSAWKWDGRRKQYYLHNFLAEQPDLNFHNPEVQQEVLSAVEFWLQRGVDGFRFDTANYFHHDLQLRSNPGLHERLQRDKLPVNLYDIQRHLYDKNRPENLAFFERLRVLLDQYGATSVGEVGDTDALQLMVDYTSGKRLHMTYSFGFLNEDADADHVRAQVQAFDAAAQASGGTSWPCWTVGNHDSVRVRTRWGKQHASGADHTRMIAAMLSSLRGSVCWYQGDELSLPEAELRFEDLRDPPGIAMWPAYKGRDGCRTPMPWERGAAHAGFSGGAEVCPWLPVPEAHQALAVDVTEQDPQAAVHFVREFWQWRNTQPAMVSGEASYPEANAKVMVVVRRASGAQAWLVACNMSNAPQRVDAGSWPAGQSKAWATLPAHQVGQRDGDVLVLPPCGIYVAAIEE